MAPASESVVFTMAALLLMSELGFNLAPLLASAGIVGVALGFGAQSLVKDLIAGLFMLLEDQYGVGDSVDLGDAVGAEEGRALGALDLTGKKPAAKRAGGLRLRDRSWDAEAGCIHYSATPPRDGKRGRASAS